MPSIKDLERFQRDLIALAREDEVLARWGEAREALAPPSSETVAKPAPRQSPSKPSASGTAAMPPDFAALLAQVPDAAEEAEPEEVDQAASDAELEALLAPTETEEEAPPAGDFDLAAFAGLDLEEETERPVAAASEAGQEDFSMPELGDFDFDTAVETAPETAPEVADLPEVEGFGEAS
ncbi:MAG TPA: hypothetical protein VMV44_10245, partial [Rectinemataceae bacterium]|nr:hypothetical protein [Rectinemataceae bacterium]